MATIDRLMARIEHSLQRLVEGTSSALLPGGRQRSELGKWMRLVMRNSTRRSPGGGWQAPDVYVISLPQDADRVDDGLLAELAHGLQAEATALGLEMLHQPVVRSLVDPTAKSPRLQVLFTGDAGGDTENLEVDGHPDGANAPNTVKGAYLIVDGLQTFLLTQSVVTIGRDPSNLLVLEDNRVSRSHAQLRTVQGSYVVFDLQSTGGTMVNGQLINQCKLAPGDVISLAGVPLVYGLELPTDGDVTQKLQSAPPDVEER